MTSEGERKYIQRIGDKILPDDAAKLITNTEVPRRARFCATLRVARIRVKPVRVLGREELALTSPDQWWRSTFSARLEQTLSYMDTILLKTLATWCSPEHFDVIR